MTDDGDVETRTSLKISNPYFDMESNKWLLFSLFPPFCIKHEGGTESRRKGTEKGSIRVKWIRGQ